MADQFSDLTSHGNLLHRSMVAASVLVYVFLILPTLVIVLSAFSPQEYPSFPPTSLSIRWFHALFTDPAWLSALGNSFTLLFIVTPLATLLGTTAAYGLQRARFKGRDALHAFVLSPLMIPEIVLGISLLYILIDYGLNGTLLGLAAGHTLVCTPYAIRTVSVSLAGMDQRLEAASMTLGATPAQTFRKITLPLITPGIVAGAIFAAVMSFGEVSVSLFVSAPSTTTVPVQVFSYIEQTFDPSVNAISVVFIVVAIIAMVLLEKTVGLVKVM